MNLKPWQKISIAISSIWILGMGAYLYSGFSSVSIGAGQTIYRVCVAEQQSLNGAELNYCNKEQGEVQQALMARQWGAIANISLLPVFLFWAIGYVIMRILKARRQTKAQEIK
jgi:hypothetical protein